jgi:hypothetical protein
MIQMPVNPSKEGTSFKMRQEVPVNNTGVNESMGMDSERSEEDRALIIRERPIIFRIAVPATAE